eukprot:CAMPEP_0172483170 /NCGR_PEP_ID=MMETSP1066-20121228/10046_1 /TAXON_ID=671091 /ORGANISM="Coscinodiscus wailesii, Strain CCMP2513" /LENGTH=319 /DNA_ID=CAMNT_0013246883 /DNA_START=249 /DNA_END=1208 /DNA_ORIENTATION=+
MQTKKRSRGKKDPNAPKKNWTSFMFFSNAKRAEIKEENPDATFGELSKLIGAEFKALSSEEKSYYIEQADEDKLRYQREMAEYSPPSSDGDSDSDSDAPKTKKKKKDPKAPKKNLSAYNYFFQAKRDEIKEDNPDATFGELSKLISQEFRSLDTMEKIEYEDKAKKDKARYESEMRSYNKRNGIKGGKTGKPVKDPNAPKKNLSSYMLYANHARAKVKERNPDATFGELGKILGQKFRNLSSKDRKKWDEKAAADKKRYLIAMEAYKKKKEESESEEESDVASAEVVQSSSEAEQSSDEDSDKDSDDSDEESEVESDSD